jgi:predicted dehydrogenase
LRDAFPGQAFVPIPDYRRVDPDRAVAEPQRPKLRHMPPGSLVFVALPDPLHYPSVMEALAAGHHVVAVKPLVLKYEDAEHIGATARDRGLFVGVEYHKRFDDRALLARQNYRAGRLGEFRLGQALLLEPWNYRDSNFQNWCTCENTDLFTYVGCHYVDLVAFITGLRPVSVSVYGIRDRYPNGSEGFLWTDGRVIWENGGCLNVINAIGYPDGGPGSNTQGLRLFCQGHGDGCFLVHEDQYRGVACCLDPGCQPEKRYHEPNPDYLRLVYRGGRGLEPVGYGYRSIEALVRATLRVRAGADLASRQAILRELDTEGILATPANSAYNELVIEAGRRSILAGGRAVRIEYAPKPRVCWDG